MFGGPQKSESATGSKPITASGESRQPVARAETSTQTESQPVEKVETAIQTESQPVARAENAIQTDITGPVLKVNVANGNGVKNLGAGNTPKTAEPASLPSDNGSGPAATDVSSNSV